MINRKEKGFSLVEFILLLSIIMIGLLLGVQKQAHENDQEKGRNIGLKLMEYNQGVARYIAINSAVSAIRDLDTDNDDELTFTGVNWLRSDECDIPGTADNHYLPCEFTDGLPKVNEMTFITRLDVEKSDSISAYTHLDFRYSTFGEGNLSDIRESMLGLAAITAMGGNKKDVYELDDDEDGSNVDSNGEAKTKTFLGATDNKYIYCPQNLSENLLDDHCIAEKTDTSSEGGLLIAIASTEKSNDSWIRTDGSNTVDSRFTFNKDAENRDIRFVDRLYNITGEALIIGNSGVFDEDNPEFSPILGSGVVFDTDMYIKGSLSNDLNINTSGEIFSGGDITTQGSSIASLGVGTDGNIDVSGDLNVSKSGLYNGGITSQRQLETNTMNVKSYIEAQNYYVLGSVVSEMAASSQYVRASESLVSDKDISITNDATYKGNVSIDGKLYAGANTFVDGDIVVDNGDSFFSSVYTDMIIDNEGSFVIDPDSISRVNTLRMNQMSSATAGGSLNLNAKTISFANEDAATNPCNVASNPASGVNCATEVKGYVDLANATIKSPADGRWVKFLDVLNGYDTFKADADDRVYQAGVISTTPLPERLTGHACNGSTILEPMGYSEAMSAESLGWSCEYQDNYIDEATGEQLYMCEASCATPTEPLSECLPSGRLEQTVQVTGTTDYVPSHWSCSQTSSVGGVPIYTCEIGCTYVPPPPPEPTNVCTYSSQNEVRVTKTENRTTGGREYRIIYVYEGLILDIETASKEITPKPVNRYGDIYTDGEFQENTYSGYGPVSIIISHYEICLRKKQ